MVGYFRMLSVVHTWLVARDELQEEREAPEWKQTESSANEISNTEPLISLCSSIRTWTELFVHTLFLHL